MTKRERREKLNWFLFMIGYFTAGYLAINWFSQTRFNFFDVSFGFETSIPFIPAFIFGYLLVYLSVGLIYAIVDDMEDWHRVVIAFMASTTLAYIIFLAFPVRMEVRPEIWQVTGSSVSAAVTRFYYYIDAPYNLFPSLHVTYPALATLVTWRNHRRMRWAFMVMSIVVAFSVVLVKQHYIADVVAGFANAGVCFAFAVYAERWLRRRKAQGIIAQIETELNTTNADECHAQS
jgi:membrane-associated phospholipid phosphatase